MHIYNKLKRTSLIALLPAGSLIAQTGADSPAEAIPYTQALQRALSADPQLKLNATRAEAAEGQVEQARLRPNPVLGAEMENIFGTGPFQDVEGIEVNLGISQLIETAGKREKRAELARTERALVDWQRESRLAALESEVRRAFVKVLVAQKSLALRQEQLALAEQSRKETARLVEAARSNEVELTRAELAVRRQKFAIGRAERGLDTARAKLAALWGDSGATDFTVAGTVELGPELPEIEPLIDLLPESVHLARYEGHRRNREAALELEQARAKPNVEVFGGGRYFNEGPGEAAFVVGVEIPWTIFDRNQGNIRSARARVRAVEYEKAATRRKLKIALTEAYRQLVSAHAEARSVEQDLLPAAEQTLEDTEEGYERGQFTLLSVLESRSALFEIRESYLDALDRYAAAQARIEALTRPSSLNETSK